MNGNKGLISRLAVYYYSNSNLVCYYSNTRAEDDPGWRYVNSIAKEALEAWRKVNGEKENPGDENGDADGDTTASKRAND